PATPAVTSVAVVAALPHAVARVVALVLIQLPSAHYGLPRFCRYHLLDSRRRWPALRRRRSTLRPRRRLRHRGLRRHTPSRQQNSRNPPQGMSCFHRTLRFSPELSRGIALL